MCPVGEVISTLSSSDYLWFSLLEALFHMYADIPDMAPLTTSYTPEMFAH